MTNLIPGYSTMLFTEIYDNVDKFLNDYNSIGIPAKITSTNATTLYYLLYARYGNSPIANKDINQFKYKLFSIIFMYGPTWEKRLAIQDKLKDLSLDDNSEIYKGSKAIYNSALNPETAPKTGDLEEINYINSQNTTNYKKSKLEGLALLFDSLRTDVTKDFIDKFNICFKKFARPGRTFIYVDDEEEEDL